MVGLEFLSGSLHVAFEGAGFKFDEFKFTQLIHDHQVDEPDSAVEWQIGKSFARRYYLTKCFLRLAWFFKA